MNSIQNWTKEEHIVAFNLYCKIPFTKINENYPPVKELANIIGRSKGAVSRKLANFARLDPVLKARDVSGLTHGAKMEEEVWNEFHGNWEDLAWQSELILAKYKNEPVELISEIEVDDLPKEGKEREALVKTRVNQNFFRKTVLASYDSRCCITGINSSALLVASHIIPWKQDVANRLNPSNGLCLNALHDKAFDKGLITITTDFHLRFSKKLHHIKKHSVWFDYYFAPYENQRITLPQKFLPKKEFLEYHNDCIFVKS